jgi:hypothetical protein
MRTLKAAMLYFVLVFGSGFLLGPIRILWLVPRLGARMAELIEAPIMLVIILVAARWVVNRCAVAPTRANWLGVGFIALLLLLMAEFSLVLWLRHTSIKAYLTGRDPVSGAVYYAELAIFAVVPLVMREWSRDKRQLSSGNRPQHVSRTTIH